jgi:putative NADH-flavin reductase
MNIVIFGASGATGNQLVSQALKGGHVVTAFVRNPAKLAIAHERLKIIQGNVSNYVQVEDAIQNQQAVISALGVSVTLKHDPAVVQGVQNIVKAMENAGVKRLVYLSTFGVSENRAELGFFAHQIMPLVLGKEFMDHDLKEDFIRKSKLEFTIVRPSRLTNGPMTGKYRHGERVRFNPVVSPVSRADVAAFMLRQLTDNTYLYKAPRVARAVKF